MLALDRMDRVTLLGHLRKVTDWSQTNPETRRLQSAHLDLLMQIQKLEASVGDAQRASEDATAARRAAVTIAIGSGTILTLVTVAVSGLLSGTPSASGRAVAAPSSAVYSAPVQTTVYSGVVTNHGFAWDTSGVSAALTVALFGNRARVDINSPLEGSGDGDYALWADSALIVTISEAGDTIAWLGHLTAVGLEGPYRVVGGQSENQGGLWSVRYVAGPVLARWSFASRPVPESKDLAELFRPFLRLPRTKQP